MFLKLRVAVLCSLTACGAPRAGVADGGSVVDADPAASGDGRSAGGSASDALRCVSPSPSTDCGAPLAPGDQRTCSISVAGVTRTYLLYAPTSFDACHPAALVVDAHGAQESAEVQAGLANFFSWPTLGIGSSFRLVADREGFLVATPQGIGNAWVETDPAFISAIPAAVRGQAAVDANRVFLSGISNGGELTYWTACADAGVFHGYAPVSAVDDSPCPVTHPAPLVHFHTPGDQLVSYASGQTTFQHWLAANHCETTPASELRFGGAGGDPRPVCLSAGAPWQLVPCAPSAPATMCERYAGCDGGDAVFCTVPPDNQYDGGQTGGHILYFNATHLSLAAVTWDILTE